MILYLFFYLASSTIPIVSFCGSRLMKFFAYVLDSHRTEDLSTLEIPLLNVRLMCLTFQALVFLCQEC